MMVFSDKEVLFQLQQLDRGMAAMRLSEWEIGFVEKVVTKDFKTLTQKEKSKISEIYENRKDSAS